MSSIVLCSGIVRNVKPLVFGAKHERAGEVFGVEAGIMTAVGDVLGETLKVAAFDWGDEAWDPTPGDSVSVIVEVDSGRFGLQGTFKRHATEKDLKTMPLGTPTLSEAKG